jgi:hypothetical protein
MLNNEHNLELRRRAEEILSKRKDKPQLDRNIYQVIEDLTLHQIELELQN